MSAHSDWLPNLVLLSDFGGDWTEYLEAIYERFCDDFVRDRPTFRGMQMTLKRHPMTDGREATFWHLISSGNDEDARLPDMRRCERICWPRPIIEDESDNGRVLCWPTTRRGEQRLALGLLDFSYVVILAKRGERWLLWTAYYVEQEHRRRKLRREYETGAAST